MNLVEGEYIHQIEELDDGKFSSFVYEAVN